MEGLVYFAVCLIGTVTSCGGEDARPPPSGFFPDSGETPDSADSSTSTANPDAAANPNDAANNDASGSSDASKGDAAKGDSGTTDGSTSTDAAVDAAHDAAVDAPVDAGDGGGGGPLWVPTPGGLVLGAWKAPMVAPDPTNARGYGGLAYAPNGDLYFFSSSGVYPNDSMQSTVRRAGMMAWSAEKTVASRLRTAHLYFAMTGQPHLAGESGGSASIYTSADHANPSPTWSLTSYFQAADSNPDGYGANRDAFLTYDGANYHLYYSYLFWSAVTGASLVGPVAIHQAAGAWPANGSAGMVFQPTGIVSHFRWPHGVVGAYAGGASVLVLSTNAYRSTNGAASFDHVDTVSEVAGSTRNPTDGAIVFGSLVRAAGASTLVIQGTRDYGATISTLATIPVPGDARRARFAAVKNIYVAVVSSAANDVSEETVLHVMTSTNGGTTWSAPTVLVDAGAGAPATTKLQNVDLSPDVTTDTIALFYSVHEGNTFKGAKLLELTP